MFEGALWVCSMARSRQLEDVKGIEGGVLEGMLMLRCEFEGFARILRWESRRWGDGNGPLGCKMKAEGKGNVSHRQTRVGGN